jgi:hypothetical protein
MGQHGVKTGKQGAKKGQQEPKEANLPWGQSPMGPKSHGAKVPCGNSPMGPKSNGPKSLGAMVPTPNGPIVPWFQRLMVPRDPRRPYVTLRAHKETYGAKKS